MKLLLLTLALLLCACAGHYVRGSVNGVSYDMSLDREMIPGGSKFGIEIRMDPAFEGLAGTLVVDGIDFGRVGTGDEVRVDDESVVTVNGEPRSPSSASETETK